MTFPRVFPASPTGSCSLGTASSIGPNTMRWLNSGVADRLNTVIREEAARAGISVVDTTDYLQGHDLCVDDGEQRWINTIIPSDLQRSIHPKYRYHERVTEAVVECWSNDEICPSSRRNELPGSWVQAIGCATLTTFPYRRLDASLPPVQFLGDLIENERTLGAGALARAEVLERIGPPPIENGETFHRQLITEYRRLAATTSEAVGLATSMRGVLQSGRVYGTRDFQRLRVLASHDFDRFTQLTNEYPALREAIVEEC